jgi:hypothetical protein
VSVSSAEIPMFRVLLILLFGIAIGYFIGFNDGNVHDKNIVHRLVDKAGGAARNGVGNDIDAKYDKIGR